MFFLGRSLFPVWRVLAWRMPLARQNHYRMRSWRWRRPDGCGLLTFHFPLPGLSVGGLTGELGLDERRVGLCDLIQITRRRNDAERAGWGVADRVRAAGGIRKNDRVVQLAAVNLGMGGAADDENGQRDESEEHVLEPRRDLARSYHPKNQPLLNGDHSNPYASRTLRVNKILYRRRLSNFRLGAIASLLRDKACQEDQ